MAKTVRKQKFVNVLHTSSEIAEQNIHPNFKKQNKSSINAGIAYLQSKEQQLYNEFGCKDFKQFIIKIRETFTGNNLKVIQKFQPKELTNIIKNQASETAEIYKEEIKIHFVFNNLSQHYNIRQGNQDQLDELVEGFSSITYDENGIKKVLKSIFKNRTFVTDLNKKGYESMVATNQLIKELLLNDCIQITRRGEGSNNFDTEYQLPPIPNFPWGCTKLDYELAQKTNNTAYLESFNSAVNEIKKLITIDMCNEATDELKNAIMYTWDQSFNKEERNPALFFQGGRGDNFLVSVQGAMGEFQTAVIFNFLGQQLNRNSNTYAKILGDKATNGEEAKMDVSVMNDLGVQVKNYTVIQGSKHMYLHNNLETTIHPNKLSQYFPDPEGFLDYIANYYFNLTYQQDTQGDYNSLIQTLGTYLGELMNLTVRETSNDTVCFYIIGGAYLVPASEILKAADELNLSEHIEITSSFRGLTDEQWQQKDGTGVPAYLQYWVVDNGAWQPTDKNTRIYNLLINHRISVRTNFNLLDNMTKYAMFQLDK